MLGPGAVEGVLRSSLVIVFSLTFLEGQPVLVPGLQLLDVSARMPSAADGWEGVVGTSCFYGTPVDAEHLGGWAEETSFPHGVPVP